MNEEAPTRSAVRNRANATLEQALALRQSAKTLQERADELVATASRLRERLFEMSAGVPHLCLFFDCPWNLHEVGALLLPETQGQTGRS